MLESILFETCLIEFCSSLETCYLCLNHVFIFYFVSKETCELNDITEKINEQCNVLVIMSNEIGLFFSIEIFPFCMLISTTLFEMKWKCFSQACNMPRSLQRCLKQFSAIDGCIIYVLKCLKNKQMFKIAKKCYLMLTGFTLIK